jgi:cell division septum initiation protein DivIVA
MSDNPEQLRAEIERTRQNLSIDVDAVADKVTPAKVAQRQTDKVRGAFSNVKDSVLGTASDARANVGDAVSGTAGGAKAKAKGNPVGLGLVAFGAGLLIASLIPASDKEKELATTVKDKAQPLVEKATDAAKDVASELKEPAQQAAQSVASTASDSAGTVKSEAQSTAQDVKGTAQDAKQTVQDDVRS